MNKEKSKNKPKAKCVILIRVSTAKQKKGTSPKTQMSWAKKKAGELNAEIIDSINVGMSGENFLKDYGRKILDIVQREKIDYILVYRIDRFTRNLSQGTDMLDKILKLGCAIVTPSEIIDETSDLLLPHIEMAISEHNRKNIVEKGKEGTLSLLSEGKYPFKNIPLGIKIIKNKNSKDFRKASFDLKFKNLIIDLFKSITDSKEYTKTAAEISERYEKILVKPIRADQVKRTLTNTIYIGFIQYEGERIGKDRSNKIPHPSLKVIDEELFNKAQKTVKSICKKRRKKGGTPLRDGLSDLIETLGFDVVINNIDGMLKLCCKKCGSINLEKNGPEVISGHYTQKYTCKEDGYQFRFPSAKQLKNLRCIDPRRCPRCGSADDFTVTRSVLSEYFQVKCSKCKYEFFAHVSDSKFKKLFDQQ